VFAWALAHQQRTGSWPTASSGPIPEAPGETWQYIDLAFRQGGRGLAGGRSLRRFLEDRAGQARL
jgi:hypothetical protein